MSLSTITQLQNSTASSRPDKSGQGRGLESLGQADFLQLMTTQLQQQDPFAPVDNTQMLAQMAQFSSLATSTDISSELTKISAKLDRLIPATPITE